ncbi:M16 family metallopeptidase [Algisphaera agarilytica]|uniref:Putative Zn-dependent peptidase n=1 Tax=Algisphaera agarilytica TaxID=1385975 RepID=A0A7X0LK75_9BACT|nr:pitrilysin family protein [Algisphaera agarilytica]MBB6430140.1 putative Zn-dependent peptidase [Algisphaera agarilytica]
MPIQFRQHTLANQLTVIAEVNPDAHTAAIGFFVKAGARDETPEVMGVSHFLEHMMFKGTARRTAEDVNREFDELGANYNAYTSHEQTVYYAHVLPEFLPRATDLIGDMLRPALRTEDFDMEKNVILEEIGMYDDRPEWVLQDKLLEDYFRNEQGGDHPLGFRVLGTTDTIKALTADQMRAYFEHRYSPDNIVVAAAGRVNFEALVADVEQLCTDWPATGAVRDYAEPCPVEKADSVSDEKLSRHYLGMLCPAPSAQDDRRYAAKVLADVLGDHEGSRLYWSIIDPGLADEADFSFMPQDGTGAYLAYASCDPARAEQVETRLMEVLDAVVQAKDITEDEVMRTKNKLATQATLQGERPAGRMQALGVQWSYQGAYTPLDEELAKLMAVTVDDVHELLADFPFTPKTVLRLGPGVAV